MQGMHLTADLRGCAHDAPALTQPEALRTLCLAEVSAAGLTAVGELFHAFGDGQGVTGVVLLAESHVAVHTWPELHAVTLDVFVCNFGRDNSAAARALLERIVQAFGPKAVQQQEWLRG